ncbi:MAG TPA: PHB depolymerase family esterase [Steroidobacteraceae bacterium]|nr:PHB depolymerase family esterase [Steroidobacteraceae bacterium]
MQGGIRCWIVCLAATFGAPVPVMALGPPTAICDAAGLGAGEHTITVLSGALSRPVRVFVPPAVAVHRALPLVLDLHGSGGNGEQQARSTRLSDVAAKYGFVVANPSGGILRPDAPERHFWNIPGVPLSGGGDIPVNAPDDVQFIRDTIGQLSANICIDARRIYVTGMSGGARMASLLGCQMADRIAAIAPVSGLRAGLPSTDNPAQPDPGSCRPQRPLPIVTFHGTDDHTNPYDGGGAPYWAYSVSTALRRWVELDHCEEQPQTQRVAAHVTLLRYTQCAAGAQIWFYRTELPASQGGGHAWPGGMTPPAPATAGASKQQRANVPGTEINASQLMWEFFSRFELPASAAPDPGP